MEGHIGALVNDDLVREIALLAWLNKSEAGEDMFRLITGGSVAFLLAWGGYLSLSSCCAVVHLLLSRIPGARVMKQVYERLSGQSMIDQMREDTVKKICAYCAEHPDASKEELSTYVQAQIAEFALKAEGISTTD